MRIAMRLTRNSAILIIFTANFLGAPAVALPFNNNNTDFQNFVNQVWRRGGAAGVEIGDSMRSSDPARDSRLYWGFHDCIWEKDSDAINGESNISWKAVGPGPTYELFVCQGYLDYTTPMKSGRCKGKISYEWRRKDDGAWGKYIEQQLYTNYGRC